MELTKSISYVSHNAYNVASAGSSNARWNGWGAGTYGSTGKYGFFGNRPSGPYRYAFVYSFDTPSWSGDVKSLTMSFKYSIEYATSPHAYLTITSNDPTSGSAYTGTTPGADSGVIHQELINLGPGSVGTEYEYSFTIQTTSLAKGARYFLVLSAAPSSGSDYSGIKSLYLGGYVTYDAYATEVSASNGYFGQNLTINMTNDGMSHALSYEFKGTTTAIVTTTSSVFTWAVPAVLMSQIPDKLSESCKIICTSVGTPTEVEITLSVPDSVKPAISAGTIAAVNENAKVNSWGIYLQNFSKLRATLSAAAQYSTIVEWTIDCGAVALSGKPDDASISVNETSGVLSTSGTFTATATVKDKRGRVSDTFSLGSFTIQSYTSPTITEQSVTRCDASGTEDKKNGTYLRAYAVSHCSDVGGRNTATLQFLYKEKSAAAYTTVSLTSGQPTIVGNGQIDVLKSYGAKIVVSDQLSSVSYTVVIGSQSIPFHLKASSKSGVGFGGYAEEDEIVDVLGGWKFRIPDGDKMLLGTEDEQVTLKTYIANMIEGGGEEITYESLTTKPAINGHTIGSTNTLGEIGAVSSISEQSTDDQFPTAKCVYDLLQNFSAGLFFCTYATTTYDEIAAAINAGKLPVVLVDDSSGSITVSQLYVFTAIYPESVRLQCNRGSYSKNISVSSANVWSKSQTNLEQSASKKTEITIATAKVTTNYPTVAAVKNYVDNMCGDIESALNALITGGTT